MYMHCIYHTMYIIPMVQHVRLFLFDAALCPGSCWPAALYRMWVVAFTWVRAHMRRWDACAMPLRAKPMPWRSLKKSPWRSGCGPVWLKGLIPFRFRGVYWRKVKNCILLRMTGAIPSILCLLECLNLLYRVSRLASRKYWVPHLKLEGHSFCWTVGPKKISFTMLSLGLILRRLEVRNMMPQLKRELGIQNSLRHKHILRVVSIVEDPMYLAGCPFFSLNVWIGLAGIS